MSRTYKDMPERVSAVKHRSALPIEHLDEFHSCTKSGYRPSDDSCTIDEVLSFNDRYSGCYHSVKFSIYYSKPEYREAVKLKVNKPLRMMERTLAIRAIKEHRAGIDDPGIDEALPNPNLSGPLSGGYWH